MSSRSARALRAVRVGKNALTRYCGAIMSVVHNAYLFKPQDFVKAVSPLALGLFADVRTGYRQLRATALRAFDVSSGVKELASWYGGWDKKSVETQISADLAESDEDIAFWFVLLLFDQLVHSGGFEGRWDEIRNNLEQIGVPQTEINLIVKGRGFDELIERSALTNDLTGIDQTKMKNIWGQFSTCFPSGSIGWLDCSDIEMLMTRVLGQTSLKSSHEAAIAPDQLKGIESVKTVFSKATTGGSGLCMIISG